MTRPPISLNVDGLEGQPVIEQERVQIFEPPRSTQGAGRVFGPGLFARVREKQGLSLFFTGVLGLGLWLLGLGIGRLTGRLTSPEAASPWVPLAWGSFFFFGARWNFRINLVRAESERRARRNDLPWTWDHPWRPEWMAPDQRPWSGLILGRLAALALIAVLNVVLPWEEGCVPRGIVLGVDVLALLLLYDSFRKLMQWARFRHPIVTWVSLPAFLGESLEGRISFARPLRLSEPPQLTLRCVHEQVERSGGAEQRKLFRVHSQTQSLLLAGGEPVDYLDFAFELPEPGDFLATDLHAHEPVYWQLLVKVPVPGPDLEARFLAPVYRKLTAKKQNG